MIARGIPTCIIIYMTSTTETQNRPEVVADKAISEAYQAYAKANYELHRANKYGSNNIEALATAVAEATITYEEANNAYTGWNRFFLVPGGHIHSSMHCSTCNRWTNGADTVATTFMWLPDLSGLEIDDAIEEYGSILCTVCYKDAPVEYTNGTNKKDADVKARKQAQAALRKTKEFKAFDRNFKRIAREVQSINWATESRIPQQEGFIADSLKEGRTESIARNEAEIAEIKAEITECKVEIAKWIAKFETARDAILPVIEEIGVQASDVNLDPFESRSALPSL